MKILHEETIGGVRYRLIEDGSVSASLLRNGFVPYVVLKRTGERYEGYEPGIYEAAESIRARNWDRLRPLAENEHRTGDYRVRAFLWEDDAVFSVLNGDSATKTPLSDWLGSNGEVFAFGLAYARKTCPQHLAVLDDGTIYRMAEDEARGASGTVHLCLFWNDSQLVMMPPGQRERVEAWRAKQAEGGEAAGFDFRKLSELADEKVRQTMANREKFIEAWVAETGLHPSQSCMLETQTEQGSVLRIVPKEDFEHQEKRIRELEEKLAKSEESRDSHVRRVAELSTEIGEFETKLGRVTHERDTALARVKELEAQAEAADECMQKLEGVTDADSFTHNGTTYFRADHPRVLRGDEFRWRRDNFEGIDTFDGCYADDESRPEIMTGEGDFVSPWHEEASDYLPPESIAAARSYWLANYQFAPGEYLDEEAGVVRRREPEPELLFEDAHGNKWVRARKPEPQEKKMDPFFTDSDGDEWEFVKTSKGWFAFAATDRYTLALSLSTEVPAWGRKVAEALRAYVASVGDGES